MHDGIFLQIERYAVAFDIENRTNNEYEKSN